MNKKSDLEDFYNRDYLQKISRRGYYLEKINYITSILSSIQREDLRILDVACNDGELSEIYSRYGKVVGVDIDKKAVKKCRQRGIKCLCTRIEEMPKKYLNYFDVVVAGDIIEHVFDTDLFLASIKAVLKKGGVLLLTTPNLVSLARRAMVLLGINPFIEFSLSLPSKEYNVGHIRYYTKDNLEQQLKTQGYKKITIVGDRINLPFSFYVPHILAKFLPTFSRNLMAFVEK